MAKEKNVSQSNKYETRFNFQELFTMKEFKSKYQMDFAKIILGNDSYTIKEAIEKLDKYFKKGRQ